VKTLGATSRTSFARGEGRRITSFEEISLPVVPRWKRILDVSLVILTGPVWIPLMLGLGGLIKLVSPGPIFFRQERIGLGEQKFTCLKLRTMRLNAETDTHQHHLTTLVESDVPMKKMDSEDKRLIPGAWLFRTLGLDELPQLINVFRGEMSLVGPRPCTAYEFQKYKTWQKERFNTLPGLTGLWQVSGKNRTTFTKMIELDITYTRTSCFWLDVGIMFRTFPAVLGQFLDNRLERAFLPSVPERIRPAVNRELKINGVAR
jgi:lipopolysaccharide/colanic/teichoic acid biosynthesis glycosyltransferase